MTMTSKSKSFIQDMQPVVPAAMRFISTPAPAEAEPRAHRGETKSRRLQVLIQPSLHERVKERALSEGRSVNDMISVLLASALDSSEQGESEGQAQE